MCRSIKTLRRQGEPATDDEVRAAALQFVRKVSGYRQPSRANAEAFDGAVDEIAATSRRLLEAVTKRRGSRVKASWVKALPAADRSDDDGMTRDVTPDP